MKYNKLLYGGGAALAIDPEKHFKFSLGTFRDKIMNDIEFRQAFIKYAIAYLKTTVMKPQEMTIDNNHVDDLLSNTDIFKV